MRIWHISDTHGFHRQLPQQEVDVVIHSGDATTSRKPAKNLAEHNSFMEWFDSLKATYKIYVPGNHDLTLAESSKAREDLPSSVTLLADKSMEIDGLNIVGIPWTREWGKWSWQVPNEHILSNIFGNFSDMNIDVLVTHGPPSGFLDETRHGINVGSTALREFMLKEKVRSILCGHIHNEEDVINTGVIPVSGPNRIVSNAAAVSNTSDQLFSGNIIEITETEILYTPGKFIQTVY